MRRQELQAEYDRFKNHISIIKKSYGTIGNDELIALSSQQVCVSICGSLEQSLKQIFIEYAKRRSNSRIYRPIEKICGSYQNPKTTKILDLVGLFDVEFGKELKRQWENEREIEKQHIDNMVDDRISIAHRKKLHVNVSSSKLEDYFNAYRELLDRIYVHFIDHGDN